MLKLTNITKTFNPGTITEKKALRGIDLTLEDGDFVTVIGGNGAGKSTLLNLIAGVHYTDTGSIELDGMNLTHKPEYYRARFLGRVFQDPMMGTAANMGIEENLAMAYRRGKRRGLKWHIKSSEKDIYKNQLKLLDLGLENRMTAKVGLLSGGQRQALTLLMAVMSKPEILLLDEHTAALDPSNAEIVMNLTKEFAKEYNLTVMMITHNMQHAISYGNRLIMMDKGEIILDISGKEKENLTLEDLNLRFRQIRKTSITTDRLVLQ